MKCRLKEILDDRGIKYGYIAEKANISKATMSLILNNKTVPTLPVAMRISREIQLKIEDIWYE